MQVSFLDPGVAGNVTFDTTHPRSSCDARGSLADNRPHPAKPEVERIEMTFPKLPFNAEADATTKYQSTEKIKHNA